MKRKTSLTLILTLIIVFFLFLSITLIINYNNQQADAPEQDKNITDADKEIEIDNNDEFIMVLPDDYLIVDTVVDIYPEEDIVDNYDELITILPDNYLIEENSNDIVDTIPPENSDNITNDTDVIPEIPNDEFLEEEIPNPPIIEDEEIPPIIDEDKEEPEPSKWNITEKYINSQEDGNGTILWELLISYDNLNASNLLETNQTYLIFKIMTNENSNTANWYAFSHAFYLDEFDNYNSTGCLNNLVHSIQFAVVTIAPDDSDFGGYNLNTLTQEHFISISEVFYNTQYNS